MQRRNLRIFNTKYNEFETHDVFITLDGNVVTSHNLNPKPECIIDLGTDTLDITGKKELFENDRVSFNGMTGVIVYDRNTASFRIKLDDGHLDKMYLELDRYRYEIIGHCHN